MQNLFISWAMVGSCLRRWIENTDIIGIHNSALQLIKKQRLSCKSPRKTTKIHHQILKWKIKIEITQGGIKNHGTMTINN